MTQNVTNVSNTTSTQPQCVEHSNLIPGTLCSDFAGKIWIADTENEAIETVPLDKIFLDRETQIRATVNEEMIQRYYEIMEDEEGLEKFPPIILYRDKEGDLWVADGHHRIMAANRREFQSIHAIIRQGEKADAIWAAVKANGRNGLPLGRADIRRAVGMVIATWPDKSDQVIADEVGCSRDTVRRARPAVPTCANAQVEKRIGKDGKARPIKRVAQTPAASAKKTVDAHEKPASKPDNIEPQSEKPTAQPDELEALSEKTGQQFGLHCRPGEKPGATGKPFVPTTLKDLRHDNPDILMSQLMAHFPREYTVGLIKSIFRGFFGRSGAEITKPLAQELYQEYGG